MAKDSRTAIAITATVIALGACGGAATSSAPPDSGEADTVGTDTVGANDPSPVTTVTTSMPVETTAPATTAPAPSATEETTAPSAPSTMETTTTTTAAPTTTLAPARPLEDAIGGTAQLDGWAVDIGRYATDRIGTPLEFDLDRAVTWFEASDLVIFGREGLSGDQRDLLFIMQPIGVIPAADASVHPPHDPVVPANTENLPADLGEWLSAISALVITGNGEADTPAGPAPYWDVVVDPSKGQTFGCFLGDCVANFVVGELGAFVFGDDLHFRVYELPGAARGVVAFVQAQPDQFDDTVALAGAILGRMTVVG
ncbi:MAG: hypothetical protein HKN41_00815 [Ilumatobacter sp.]|nr:hypothetical protein [Ilumatobacter sp.]